MNRKKLFSIWILSLTICVGLFSACKKEDANDARYTLVATNFPAYDFARQLTKGCSDFSVRMLLSPGTESHSYDPSAADILAVRDCALFLYIGGDADAWADKIITAVPGLKTFSMMDCVSLLAEDEDEMDPHVWTSPANASEITAQLAARLCALPELSAENAETIQKNDTAYRAELETLDQDFAAYFSAADASHRTLIFGDRFPFRYFADRYGLSVRAAFPGCSEESEPAASTIASLIDEIRSKQLQTVFYVEFSNHRVADAIAEETGCKTALLHSCHNVTQAEFDAGETYLSLMRQNLETLKHS